MMQTLRILNAPRTQHATVQRFICGLLVVAIGELISTRIFSQQPTTTIQVKSEDQLEDGIVRQRAIFPGWDPYEPVPAYVYFRRNANDLPVVIFIHGMGASKSYLADWHADLARRGFTVISIDAHLSGDRRIATSIGGIKGEQDWVWPHQTVVNHTANDVSKMLDVLSTSRTFDPARVAVTGFSMGGATTMVLAWREPRLSAVMPL